MEPLIPIALFFCAAAVLILRPVTARLGNLFDAMAREKRAVQPGESAELARLRNVLEHMSGRLDLLEERLDFTERLLSSGESRSSATAIPPGDPGRRTVV